MIKKLFTSLFSVLLVYSVIVLAVPIPVSVYLNVLDNGGGVDTSKKLTIYHTGEDGSGNPLSLSVNTVDDLGQEILNWGPFGGDPAVMFATIEIKPSTDVIINVEGYQDYTFPSISGNIDDGQGGPLDIIIKFCDDTDSDGYGVCPNCGITNGCVYEGDDCDDTNPNINPGATEVCNEVDDDCNAATPDGADEAWLGNACDGDDTDLCQEGAFVCTTGAKTCTDNNAEHDLDLCNNADDDCNAATADGADEVWLNAACDGADSDLCEEGLYACTAGAKTCTDDTDDDIEVCDYSDNDCDGTTDEDCFKHNITFYDDWNLISVPLTLDNMEASSVFSDLDYSKILSFNNNNKQWSELNNNDIINTKKGYWMKSNEGKTIELFGHIVQDTTITLEQGANLIGRPSLNEALINETFDVSEINSVFMFNNSNWYSYNPNRPDKINTLTKFIPGFGYWVNIK